MVSIAAQFLVMDKGEKSGNPEFPPFFVAEVIRAVAFWGGQ
jgi:hypothetical protein